jgi:CRISPR/Cas system-associated exonuclease Cas4 (RecB family)
LLSIQFKISTEQIKNLADENKIILTNNGTNNGERERIETPQENLRNLSNNTHQVSETSVRRTIIIHVTMLTKYMFCNYQPYLQYVKSNKINGEWLKEGENSHRQLAEKEKKKFVGEKKFVDAQTILDAVKKSTECEDVFTFHEVLLKAEIIPGIILLGVIDKLDVWKGRLILTERKFVMERKMPNPYDNEVAQITAYAMLLKKNFGIHYEDMNCSIDLFDVSSKRLIRKCQIEIYEKNIATVKKNLWELGAIIVGARIPNPTKNKNKCAVCFFGKKKLCDAALVIQR